MDSETLVPTTEKSTEKTCSPKKDRDDLGNMFTDFFGKINFKIAIFLFIFGIFIFSDIFIEHVLGKIGNATSADATTSKGTMIQLLIMVLFYLVVDLFVQGEVI